MMIIVCDVHLQLILTERNIDPVKITIGHLVFFSFK